MFWLKKKNFFEDLKFCRKQQLLSFFYFFLILDTFWLSSMKNGFMICSYGSKNWTEIFFFIFAFWPFWSKYQTEVFCNLYWILVDLNMLYSHNRNTSGNIIKDDLRLQWTHFFIKIYLSHFILKRVNVSVVCERWVERGLLIPISSSWSQEVPVLAPPMQAVSSDGLTLLISCVSLAWLRFSALCLNLTAWFSTMWSPSGYTSVVPKCPNCAVLFTNHVTACQSTQGH